MRIKADNPGAWFMHCHMEWHLGAGMGFVISVKDPKTNSYNLGDPPHDFKKCGRESDWTAPSAHKVAAAAENLPRFQGIVNGAASVSPGSPFSAATGKGGAEGAPHSSSSSTGSFLLGVVSTLLLVFARRFQAAMYGVYTRVKKKTEFSLLELATLNAVSQASHVYHCPQQDGGWEEDLTAAPAATAVGDEQEQGQEQPNAAVGPNCL